ncbi:hypothetical protein T02_4638 [Trichinella nativa]|uniref:Uncharacterized protein n=1 Tax=Trichinella nativa TaxID=6335 RepID=A0A0V1LDM2_9BILA|nr:hypothetical protein T02_4638 [Trichinella nativa]
MTELTTVFVQTTKWKKNDATLERVLLLVLESAVANRVNPEERGTVFDDMRNVRRVVKDILIFSKDYNEHIKSVRTACARAANNNIALNAAKTKSAESTVRFGGCIIIAVGF